MLVTGAVTTMVVLAFLIPLALLVRGLAGDRVVTAAERDAEQVAQLIALRAPEADVLATALRVPLDQSEFPISIVVGDEVIGAPIPAGENLDAAKGGAAFRASVSGGQAIYAPIIIPSRPEAVVVRVFISDEQLTAGVTRSWVILGLLGLILVLIALVVSDRLGRSMVDPVRRLSATAAMLGHGNLDARVVPSGPPEVREVGAEFNRLAARITTLLRLEREAAADLSHRLRTPLTAVRLDLEAVEEGPAKERLLDDIDEMGRTVDFVIRAARHPGRADARPSCDLAELVAARVQFWSALAEEQNRVVTVHIAGGSRLVAAGADDVTAMIDALLGNVMAHTPEGTDLTVTVAGEAGEVRLTVADEGPGFDARLAERGRSSAGSTGLGLDIVRRTAEASGGSLSITAGESGGAAVVVTLGPAESEA